jgi:hypothetical protein
MPALRSAKNSAQEKAELSLLDNSMARTRSTLGRSESLSDPSRRVLISPEALESMKIAGITWLEKSIVDPSSPIKKTAREMKVRELFSRGSHMLTKTSHHIAPHIARGEACC